MDRIIRLAVITLGVLAVVLTAISADAGVIRNFNSDPHWTRITEPIVNWPLTRYDEVQIPPGSLVKVSAGGCVQTGGKGKTWKHYVRPRGSHAEYLYHGQIMISGLFYAPTNFSTLHPI
jgi:hypothetical protein